MKLALQSALFVVAQSNEEKTMSPSDCGTVTAEERKEKKRKL
jgi:hypothetical protein